MKTIEERKERIIAKGVNSSHAHVITGECVIEKNDKNEVKIKAGKDCFIKHLVYEPFITNGEEVWTKEHKDIMLTDGECYEYVPQVEYDPYLDAIQNVQD